MVEGTPFGNVIVFLEKLGVYDIVLPFLLVFTIVFAVFERTKVFGTEEVDGVKYSRKNLNAMVAFVIAFLVVASSQLVGIINKSLSRLVLLILVSISFLVLIGTFFSEKEEVILELTEEELARHKEAASVCPVQVIHIEDVETGEHII